MSRPNLTRVPLLLGLCWLAAAAACGDDAETSRNNPVAGGPRRDAGRVPHDAGEPPDARAHDTEIFSGERYLCGYDDDDVFEFAGSAQAGDIAIATDERGFGLAYRDAAGSLFLDAVPVQGEAQEPVRIVAASDAPESTALAANDQGFLLAFRSGTRLRARALPSVEVGSEASTPRELSEKLAQLGGGGEPFALVALPEAFVAALLEDEAGELRVRLVRLHADGTPDGAARSLPEIAERAPLSLRLAHLGGGRLLLAWAERDAMDALQVMGVRLSSELEPEAEPVQLSKHAMAQAGFDLAAHGQSAGLLYPALDGGVREAIKFRRIEPAGVAEQAVLNVVNAPGRVVAGSIAAFGQGYAIAFRELPSLGMDATVIKVAFVNQFGRVVHEAALADASLIDTTNDSAPTSVAATIDGHVLVGFTSTLPGGTTTHAVKMDCPGALILCGGGG